MTDTEGLGEVAAVALALFVDEIGVPRLRALGDKGERFSPLLLAIELVFGVEALLR